MATRAALVVVGLITSVVVARSLGADGRGLFAVAAIVTTIGIHLGLLGLNDTTVWVIARDRRALGRLLGDSLLVSFVFGGFGALVIFGMFTWFPALSPIPLDLMALALLAVPFGVAVTLLANLLLGLGRARAYNSVLIVHKAGATVLIVCLVLAGTATILSTYGLVVLAMAVATFLALTLLLVRERPRITIDLSTLRHHTRFGAYAYLSNLLMLLLMWADVLIVQYMLGDTATGEYAVAASGVDALRIVPVALGSWLLADLSGNADAADRSRRTRRSALLVAAAMGAVAVVAGLLADSVIPALFGEEFEPSVLPFILLLPGLVLLSVRAVLWAHLGAVGMPRVVVVAPLVGIIANVALNLMLVPTLGIEGAAIASSVSYGLVVAIAGSYLFRSQRTTARPDQ